MIYLFILIGVYFVLIWPIRAKQKNIIPWLNQVEFAHRGLFNSNLDIPENSMKSFKQAVVNGYGIELDIQTIKDNSIVIFHDDDLIRMCGQTILLRDLTKEELKQFNLNNTNETIPLFKDVLKMVNGSVPIYIEFKNFTLNYKTLCEETVKLLENYQGDFFIASFNPFILSWFKKHYPSYYRAIIVKKDQNHSRTAFFNNIILKPMLLNIIAKPHIISYQYEYINLSFRICRALKAYTVAWTIRNEDERLAVDKQYDGYVFEYHEKGDI